MEVLVLCTLLQSIVILSIIVIVYAVSKTQMLYGTYNICIFAIFSKTGFVDTTSLCCKPSICQFHCDHEMVKRNHQTILCLVAVLFLFWFSDIKCAEILMESLQVLMERENLQFQPMCGNISEIVHSYYTALFWSHLSMDYLETFSV